jgi:hypothetical protein
MKTPAQGIRNASANRALRRAEVRVPRGATMLLPFAVVAPAFSARARDNIGNEYRSTIFLHHPIKGDFTGFGQFES